MSKPSLSDEEIYSTLENVISSISKKIQAHSQHPSTFPDQEILGELQKVGYNPKMSWAFLRACYWHLRDQEILDVDPSNHNKLTERITEEGKTDLCMDIFSKYGIYLKTNYEHSLIEPNPYHKPDKAFDSSLGFQYTTSFGGK